MKIASFFSGAGGLDLGFTNAGFDLAFANDNWQGCWETFERNHNHQICKKSITEIKPDEIPEVVGFVGGPPCQSWSLAGAMRGINDSRGKLFYNYVELIKAKQPLFFLAENVAGILSDKHLPEFKKIIQAFKEIGYNVSYEWDVGYDGKQFESLVVIILFFDTFRNQKEVRIGYTLFC